MKTASAKAKGRRAAARLREAFARVAPFLEPDDIRVTPSGCTGPDLLLSPAAKKVFPFAVECKNVEKLNIWEALKQAQGHVGGYFEFPLLAFTRNNEKMYVAMELDDFLCALKLPEPQCNPEE